MFDLSTDVKEVDNVVTRYPEKAKQMRQEIIAFLAFLESPIDNMAFAAFVIGA